MNYKKKRCKRHPKHACGCGTKGFKRDGNRIISAEDVKKVETLQEEVRSYPSHKKDTKRWCRGKVGVEHIPEWVKNPYMYVYACTSCGKHFDFCFEWLTEKCKCGHHSEKKSA